MNEYKVSKDFELHLHDKPPKASSSKVDYFVLAKYSSVGYYLVTPLIIGVILGFGLDSYFDSKPFFSLTFIIIGFVSTIYNMYRLVREEEQRAKNATHQHKG